MGGAPKARQQRRQAVRKCAGAVAEPGVRWVRNIGLQPVRTREFAVPTFFICRPEHRCLRAPPPRRTRVSPGWRPYLARVGAWLD